MGCFEIDVWLICEAELSKIKQIMEHFGHVCQDRLIDASVSISIAKFQMYPPQLSSYVSPHP